MASDEESLPPDLMAALRAALDGVCGDEPSRADPGRAGVGHDRTWPGAAEARLLEVLSAVERETAGAAAVPPAAGEFGRYMLLRELDRGGFSVVYLAVDP